MAYEIGTATNYADLLAKLRTFLTTNADLVAADQAWTVIGGAASGTPGDMGYVSFKGTGLDGADQIFASIRLRATSVSNFYNWEMYGHASYNPASPGVLQPGNPQAPVSMLLTNNTIAYWFFANGRHFKVVTRISGRYDASYVGLMLPDHTPLDWSLPFFLGGSSYLINTGGATLDTWQHTNFWQPNSSQSSDAQSTAYLLNPAGAWRSVRNNWLSGESENFLSNGAMLSPNNGTLWPRNLRRCLDDSAWLQRINACQIGNGAGANSGGAVEPNAPDGGNWYGALDGVYFSPAFGAAAEEIVTFEGKDYILFPNIARTGNGQFAALALE